MWREDTAERRSTSRHMNTLHSALCVELAHVYRTRVPSVLPPLFPEFIWRGSGQSVHLTFDDGPHPEWTPFVLDELGRRGQKGTFFCLGKNILKYPEVFDRIRNEGHAWGNHTMQHESGWSTPNRAYLRSYLECEALTQSGLFRPPYGRIKVAQAKAIATRSQVVMWTVLSGDFDVRRRPDQCLKDTLRAMRPGSIAVMHESAKAGPRLTRVLPGVLDFLEARDWRSEAMSMRAPSASTESRSRMLTLGPSL